MQVTKHSRTPVTKAVLGATISEQRPVKETLTPILFCALPNLEREESSLGHIMTEGLHRPVTQCDQQIPVLFGSGRSRRDAFLRWWGCGRGQWWTERPAPPEGNHLIKERMNTSPLCFKLLESERTRQKRAAAFLGIHSALGKITRRARGGGDSGMGGMGERGEAMSKLRPETGVRPTESLGGDGSWDPKDYSSSPCFLFLIKIQLANI